MHHASLGSHPKWTNETRSLLSLQTGGIRRAAHSLNKPSSPLPGPSSTRTCTPLLGLYVTV